MYLVGPLTTRAKVPKLPLFLIGRRFPAVPKRRAKRKVSADVALLERAIDLSGLSARGFALKLLGVDERTVRYWLAEDRGIPGPVRVICKAIIAEPSVTTLLKAASDAAKHPK